MTASLQEILNEIDSVGVGKTPIARLRELLSSRGVDPKQFGSKKADMLAELKRLAELQPIPEPKQAPESPTVASEGLPGDDPKPTPTKRRKRLPVAPGALEITMREALMRPWVKGQQITFQIGREKDGSISPALRKEFPVESAVIHSVGYDKKKKRVGVLYVVRGDKTLFVIPPEWVVMAGHKLSKSAKAKRARKEKAEKAPS